MARTRKNIPDLVSLLPSDGPSVSLEALETRLESHIAALPTALDDAHCLYYLCTTRCSATKCPVFCACDVVIDLGGI